MATRRLLGIGSDGKLRTPQSADGLYVKPCLRGANVNYQVTISGGSIAVHASTSLAAVDTEAAAASDDLDNVTGGNEGMILTLFAATSSRTVVLRDGVGNLRLAGNFSMDSDQDSITLIKRGSNWLELGRANSGT